MPVSVAAEAFFTEVMEYFPEAALAEAETTRESSEDSALLDFITAFARTELSDSILRYFFLKSDIAVITLL